MIIRLNKKGFGKNVSIFAAILMFCVIHHPPILGINILYLITPIVWVYILLHYKYLLVPFDKKSINKMIIWILFLIMYQSMVSLFNGYSIISASVGMIWWVLAIIPSAIVINHYICTQGFGEDAFNNSLLFASLLQVFFAILAYVSPEIRAFFMRNIDYSKISYMYAYRMYGFARYLTGFTAFAQGAIAAYFFWLGITKNKKYFLSVPLILFSAVINARTSMVIFIGAVLVIFFTSKLKFTSKMIFAVAIILSVIGGNYLLEYLRLNSTNQTVGFVVDFFDVMKAFFNGDTTGYFIYATNSSKYVLPTGIQFIFGTGKNIFKQSIDVAFTSDIGFVNDIWVGGIVFVFLYYSFWIWLCLLLKRKISKTGMQSSSLAFVAMIAIALVVSNFKGIVNTDNDLVSFILIVATFCLIRRNCDERYFNGNSSSL